MECNVYCDESCHLVNNDSKYMLIGAVYCPKNKVKKINDSCDFCVHEIKLRYIQMLVLIY